MAAENTTWTDPRERGALPDVYIAMGQTAENVATSRGVSRERQDEWGVTSQNRAQAAIDAGLVTAAESVDASSVTRRSAVLRTLQSHAARALADATNVAAP